MHVRSASPEDAPELAHMLRDFNLEFGDPSPEPDVLAARIEAFIRDGTKSYLLAGPGPDGFAQVSFNASIWSDGPVLLIEELYVRPAIRRQGMGRALMETIVDLARSRGAESLEVITGEDDTGARALYELFGFRNEIEGTKNARALFYMREL